MSRKNYVRIGVAALVLKDHKNLTLLNKKVSNRRSSIQVIIGVYQVVNWKYHKNHWITFLTKTDKFKGIAQIKEPNNHVDFKWFDLDNLPKIIFKADKELIKNYINKVGLSQKIVHYNKKN